MVTIDNLLPRWTVVCQTTVDIAPEHPDSAELEIVKRANDARRAEFLTGRLCAHGALRQIGRDVVTIGKDANGAPIWPKGIVGSITHCPSYRGAVVAHMTDAIAIGIDAEPNQPLPDGLSKVIATEYEYLSVLRQNNADAVHWDRLLFSAKESFIKAFYMMSDVIVRPEEVRVSLDEVGGFTATVEKDSHVPSWITMPLLGRWQAKDDLLMTAISVHPKPD